MAKARFIKEIPNSNPFDKHAWEHTDLLYEYRGQQYIVTRHNNGFAFNPLWQQHKEAQEEIDNRLDNPEKEHPEWTYEGSAQEGFDIFWEYVNEA